MTSVIELDDGVVVILIVQPCKFWNVNPEVGNCDGPATCCCKGGPAKLPDVDGNWFAHMLSRLPETDDQSALG